MINTLSNTLLPEEPDRINYSLKGPYENYESTSSHKAERNAAVGVFSSICYH